jgi:hypothetical protein
MTKVAARQREPSAFMRKVLAGVRDFPASLRHHPGALSPRPRRGVFFKAPRTPHSPSPANLEKCTSNLEKRSANSEKRSANLERHTANLERHTANLERHTANLERHTANSERHTANSVGVRGADGAKFVVELGLGAPPLYPAGVPQAPPSPLSP